MRWWVCFICSLKCKRRRIWVQKFHRHKSREFDECFEIVMSIILAAILKSIWMNRLFIRITLVMAWRGIVNILMINVKNIKWFFVLNLVIWQAISFWIKSLAFRSHSCKGSFFIEYTWSITFFFLLIHPHKNFLNDCDKLKHREQKKITSMFFLCSSNSECYLVLRSVLFFSSYVVQTHTHRGPPHP